MGKLRPTKENALREQQGKVPQPSTIAAPLLHGFQKKAAGEVDLHGLYVKEAIGYSMKAITEARRRGDSEVRLIVGMCISSASRLQAQVWCHGSSLAGRGTHSDGGVSRLKPAIQKEMRRM